METARVERGLVGAVRAEEVDIRESGVGAAAAERDMYVSNAGAGALAAGGNLSITNGGGGPMLVRGNLSIVNGGAQTIMAAGGATLGERSFVAFVLSPKVTMEPGARCSRALLDHAGAGPRNGHRGGDPRGREAAPTT